MNAFVLSTCSCDTGAKYPPTRDLEWDGCFNARDLGGLPSGAGGATRHGALVRADALSGLTEEGWRAALAHGVRTVIDLRNRDELGPDASQRPAEVRTLHLPLDASEERDFWDIWSSGPQFGTPLYYGPHLERFPERSAAVLAAIANADPGGVAFHCEGGRDRSGQVTMLLLALAEVPAEEIAADYALSHDRLAARYAERGEEDQAPRLRGYLEERGTSAEAVIVELLGELDVEERLRAAGLAQRELAALRGRLLDA